MRVTFELPEGVCDVEYGDKRCPMMQEYGCWGEIEGHLCVLASGTDYERELRSTPTTGSDRARHPTCPFHGPVRVTMEDDHA